MTSLPLRPLGRTGVRVPNLCLGTMTFGLQCDEETSFAILDHAFARAREILTRNRAVLDRAAAELLERETVDEVELAELAKGLDCPVADIAPGTVEDA